MHLKSHLSTVFLALTITLQLYAENQPTIEHITSNNGLSHNTIRCMLQDTTGFLWFGSLNGLNRFDGIELKTLNPENKNLNSFSSGKIKELHKDKNGHIWVRTYSDIMHCYNPFTEKFLPVFGNKVQQNIKHNLYYEDNQKNVWLGGVTSGCVKISFTDNKITLKTYLASEITNTIPSNTVNDILQDSKFNTWILTSKGITRIQNDKIIKLSDNRCDGKNIVKAYETGKKIFFIQENGSIEIFNLKTEKFEKTIFPQLRFHVFKTALLGNDMILISTVNQGIYIFNIRSNTLDSDLNLFGERITGNAYFQADQLGGIWIYNLTGNVWLTTPYQNEITKLNLIPRPIMMLIDEERYQFQSDKHGNVWITTFGNGLFCFNYESKKLSHYSFQKNKNGISSNYLLSITLDKNENRWVGTESMGINKLSFSNRNVKLLYPDPFETVKNGNVVRSFLEDNKGNIWVGTKAGNLYQYDSTLSSKTTIIENGYNVYSMFQEKNGTIWLATRGNGVIELKNNMGSKPVFYKHTDDPSSLSNNSVFSLLVDRKGRLWTATFGGGVCVKINKEGKTEFLTFFNDDEWIRFTRFVFEDKTGNIWVASANGVLKFNPDELLLNAKAYKYYTFRSDIDNSLSNPEVRYIFQDSKNRIWLASAGGGINLFEGETKQGDGIFKVFRNQQGISNDNVMAIQEDTAGTLWVSTESGLHSFNPDANLFQYYKFSDDFSSNLFSESTSLRCRDGRLLWGSLNGFYVFHPKDLLDNRHENNKVVLTGFYIYDDEAKIEDKKAPLKKSISYSDKIILSASDKVFHIDFSNLNFRDPKANQFKFILENYEKRWNESGSYNVATYRNVPHGKYIFKVKSVNSQGLWDDNVTTLEIIIKPPFWLSIYAYILYFILFAAAAYIAFKLVLKFNTLNNAVKVERQLTDYKLRFFTNISHEFRTPLTLIKGSVDTLNELKTKMAEPLQLLVDDLGKNTTHLLRLIEQLLEFRKLQNNKQKLNLQRVDAVEFLNEIFTSFSNVASKMNIEYRYLPSRNSIPIFLDKNKVDKIVFNLLSNAFKFTPRGGRITLLAEADDTLGVLRISVSDNGIGIPKDKQNMLFSRFMQINFSSSGTGIGLSLVNEFTVLHKGTVKFTENEGGGSVFTLEFSLNSNIYDKDDFVNEQVVVSSDDKKEVYSLSEFIDQNDSESLLNLVPNVPIAGHKYKILVIDDNDDIRDFLTNKLSNYFEIITAEDGNIGIQKSIEDDPDLILCDVMMPGLNGFELTKKLKDNFATCHIPVILLTAYISDEHHTEGIASGADAYISKPFSMKHLMLQINKLLEKRELLHKHYAGSETTDISSIEEVHSGIPAKDTQFLKQVEEFLEKNLTNPDFSVDDFAQLMNTGRTLFFKKIKYLTGYTPNEFIRVRRMKKAAELLKTYKYNVSEVSYMVGINDPFYFSKCFKAQFGCSPSKFINS